MSVSRCRVFKKKSVSRPNVVFILADDLGYGDVGCYNPESKISTPNMDLLAKQGVRFTDCHSPSAFCSPTRYGILTGRYCWRTWLKRGVVGGYTPPLIEPDPMTVASFLKRQGYTTGCFVKWHLGLGWTRQNGFTPSWKDAESMWRGSWQDSFNILPALLGKKSKTPIREALVSHSENGTFAIRKGGWKLILDNKTSGGWVEPSGKRPVPGSPGQLYSLADDPYEKKDLWEKRQDVVGELTKLLERYKREGRSASIR